ncbi:MAG TPA: helix-hairpin-helix domain-containing protein [Gemmatimonadales bacterium]|nr:helix-hairpin-helix domain-containing protein [Gemmatimonadales bacterium]
MAASLNRDVAARLDEVAGLLEAQGANAFRVAAYRRGADAVRRLQEPVSLVLEQRGVEGLEQVPHIGPSLARAIRSIVDTGRLPMLDRLRGESDAVAVLESVPGVGPVFAQRLHEDLGIDSLEDLEAAAHDGRLAQIAGIGEKRLAGIRDSLAGRLAGVRIGSDVAAEEQPPIDEVLSVDREYRSRAEAGQLKLIAPRRFNPEGKAWLPVLHTERGERRYTALYSNTARAHLFGRTRDWVVVYVDHGRGERQCTVITARRGVLKGKRVIAGREAECARYYVTRRTAAVVA